ncbi:YciI family protein [Aquisalimonas sp.]|uniref:YciI family protein n=1 Tax=Aquisalimonas sp. TaxID=1872621 RepID=UPI0025C4BE96|nr:YciI family protein [Aquisalimonas sp.]
MKYLCLIYVDEQQLADTPAELVEQVGQDCLAHADELRARGRLVACERLESVQTASTVRTRGDHVSITDGPFAETKEQLAGFFLIEARDLNEAIRIASHIPPGRFGCVEVRPVAA